jgi:O-antigen biosynthesis protein WbqP
MVVVGVAILVDSGWPVLLHQRRIGRYGHEYRMWKFRTLPKGTPEVAKSQLALAAMRLTTLGRFLRRHSLDELPQLLNVLAGDMSLVGPRPALYTQHDLTAMRLAQGVLTAKPGLTGLAQVSGREDLSLAEKVSLDASYVRSMSLLNDARILLRTISLLMRPRGSY